MISSDATCCTLVRVAAGDVSTRDRFTRVYMPVFRAFIAARWRGDGREVDDAAMEVFVACFKTDEVLDKVDSNRVGGFQAYLFSVVRNVAL